MRPIPTTALTSGVSSRRDEHGERSTPSESIATASRSGLRTDADRTRRRRQDGKVIAFIPDPREMMGTSAAEGVAVDAKGNVYGGEVGPQQVARHARQ